MLVILCVTMKALGWNALQTVLVLNRIPKKIFVFIVQSIAHVSLVRSIVIKTASADAGISCKEAFRESEASKSVGISW